MSITPRAATVAAALGASALVWNSTVQAAGQSAAVLASSPSDASARLRMAQLLASAIVLTGAAVAGTDSLLAAGVAVLVLSWWWNRWLLAPA